MSGLGLVLVGLAMLVGLAGTVVPLLPGLPLIWAAGLVWALLSPGSSRWVALALLTLLAAGGLVAHYALPARSLRRDGGAGKPPRSTLLLGLVGALAGMVFIPVVGFVVGGVAGVYVAELRRTRDGAAAWAATKRVLVAFGIGTLVEVGTGVLMVLIWLLAVVALL